MSDYNISKGRYWSAPGPDGDFIVFWHHPDDGKIHHQVAVFFDADRAARYVDVENGLINPAEPPVCTTDELHAGTYLKPNIEPYVPPAVTTRAVGGMRQAQFVELCATVRNDLPQLFKKYPYGFTSKNIREFYAAHNIPYDRSCQLLRWLEIEKLGQYVHLNGTSGPKVFLPPDAEVIVRELTDQQDAVLKALNRNADKYRMVQLSASRIADEAGVPVGSATAILIAIEKKGFVMLAKPSGGSGGPPPIYQLTDKVPVAVTDIAGTEMAS